MQEFGESGGSSIGGCGCGESSCEFWGSLSGAELLCWVIGWVQVGRNSGRGQGEGWRVKPKAESRKRRKPTTARLAILRRHCLTSKQWHTEHWQSSLLRVPNKERQTMLRLAERDGYFGAIHRRPATSSLRLSASKTHSRRRRLPEAGRSVLLGGAGLFGFIQLLLREFFGIELVEVRLDDIAESPIEANAVDQLVHQFFVNKGRDAVIFAGLDFGFALFTFFFGDLGAVGAEGDAAAELFGLEALEEPGAVRQDFWLAL